MVQVLHARGYRRLRIVPGMSPSGCHWRCGVTHVANISRSHGAMDCQGDDIAYYTSASEDEYFDWTDARDDTPEQLADKFVERFPELARKGEGEDPAYAAWYRGMLSVAEEDALPVAYSDYGEDLGPGLMATTRSRVTVPLPPPGEGAESEY